LIKELKYHPFPGLKPYTFKDSQFFSGRERQKYQLLKILGESNFVAVVGGQGVGKTSFVNSKIIPELMNEGLLAKGKSSWKVISFRPGKNPLSSFATALSRVDVVQKFEGEKIDPNLNDRFEHILRDKNFALIEIIEEFKLAEKDNFLIYIDHLDDLLFYSNKQSESANRDIKLFIKRLVEVANQSAYSICIVTTLRTEMAGHFSIFPEFAEIINKNQFLLGAFDAKDLMPIFENVTKNGGIIFEKDFLKHIKDFYKDNPLYLGQFQHAMKSCFDFWKSNGSNGPIGLEHLKEVGGLNSTIEHQLDDIYGYMNSGNKKTCRLMFQAITETSASDTDYSIPRTIQEISEITDQTSAEIVEVASKFTDKSCGVIVKFDPQDITGRLEYLDHAGNFSENLITEHSEITLSQDFIIEEWPRLHKWVKEEHLNSNIFRDIAYDAERNDPPYEGEKLLSTWKWYQDVQPHAGWAKQYNKNFNLVEEFILKSKKISDREIERRRSEELSREQKTRRTRNIKIVFSLVALILTIFAFIKTREASEAAQEANEQQSMAKLSEAQAIKAKEEAAFEKRTAELSILQASRDRELAQKALDSAKYATERARVARQEALIAQNKAQLLRVEANKLTKAVSAKNVELSKAEIKIERSKVKEDYLAILEAVREYSDEVEKILGRSNNTEQRMEAARIAANAYQEFQKIFQSQYIGIRDTTKENTQNKLFSAMTKAYQKVGGSQLLSKINYGTALSKNHTRNIGNGSAEYIIGTNDNSSTVYRVVIENGRVERPNIIANAEIPEKKIMGIKDLSYSNAANHFLVSHLPIDQNSRYISKYDYDGNLLSSNEVPTLINTIIPYKENDFLVADQTGNLHRVDGSSNSLNRTQLYKANDKLRAIDYHAQSGQLFLALSQGVIIQFNLLDNTAEEQTKFSFKEFDAEISAVKYIDSKKWLMVATRTGELYLYDVNSQKCIYSSLRKHAGYINCLKVNDDEKLMASGGRDKILNIWNLDDLVPHTYGNAKADKEYETIEFEESESIRDVSFLDDNWLLVIFSDEGLSPGKGGAFLLPLNFDITGRELKRLVD
jgi:hypothetical protein